MITDTIDKHAHAVSEAHSAVRLATSELAAAQADHQVIADRINAIHTNRSAIIARRQAGDARPGDAGEIELLAADVQGLEGILAERKAEVAKAKTAQTAARQMLASAQSNMQRAEDAANLAALKEHAGKLDALLLATVQQIVETQNRLGDRRAAWAPSKELHFALRKLAAAAGIL